MNSSTKGARRLRTLKSCYKRNFHGLWRPTEAALINDMMGACRQRFVPNLYVNRMVASSLHGHSAFGGTSRRRFLSTVGGNYGDFPWDTAAKTSSKGPVHGGIGPQPLVTTTASSSTNKMASSTQLLDEASTECGRILAQTRASPGAVTVTAPVNYDENDDAGADEAIQEKMKELEDAADSLLAATKVTIPLAQIITYSPNDERVHSLHRSFLGILQKCVSALTQAAANTSAAADMDTHRRSSSRRRSTPLFSSESEPPLLEKTLRLAVRAREDLGLPFHLPLYKLLAVSVTLSSSSSATITRWVLQAGRWAQEDFGSSCMTQGPEEFFARPLWNLAHRRRYSDLLDILYVLLLTDDFDTKYLQSATLEGILRILYEDLQTHLWEPSPMVTSPRKKQGRSKPLSYSSRLQHQREYFRPKEDALDLEEILMLLEPSIYNVFGYTSATPEDSKSLRDIIDVLLATSSNQGGLSNRDGESARGGDSVSLSGTPELLQALFPEQFPDDFPSDEFEEYYYDDDDDDESDGNDRRHLTSGTARWEFHVDMDSDLAVVGVTRVFRDDEDDDDWDSEASTASIDTEMIYTRSMLEAKIPDIVHQVEQVIGKPLQYSKGLERELFDQMADLHEHD